MSGGYDNTQSFLDPEYYRVMLGYKASSEPFWMHAAIEAVQQRRNV
jgi:hypothetical protein